MDIKYIVNTHGHYDHCGATRALAEMTGAKTFLGAKDLTYVNGETALHLGGQRSTPSNCFQEPFTPDVLLKDGDHIVLGNTDILCLEAPGHTPGTMAFFFDVTDGENTYRAGMHGGVGSPTMKIDFINEFGIGTQIREQFVPGILHIMDQHVDIHLGNHVGDNDTIGKGAAITEDHNPFIDPAAWRTFLEQRIARYERLIREENE